MGFADKLQNYRKQKGMSQENLAEQIGVSRQAVSKWESGQSYPELDKLIKLSELFHVSLDHLVKEDPEPTETVETPSRLPHYRLDHYHYEFKSKTTWFGVPLVHINIGRGLHVAKGIIAIGNFAFGLLSVGLLAFGGFSLGLIAIGLLAFAGISIGLLLAMGGIAVGAVAVGGVALGIITIGGLSIGMYALGGCALASKIAIGGYASGHIAIGETAKGVYTLVVQNHDLGSIQSEQVRQLINQEYPHLWKPLNELILLIFR